MTQTQKLLRLSEAAKRLGEPVSTIKAWIDVGLIPTIKRDMSRRVPAEIVEKLLESESDGAEKIA